MKYLLSEQCSQVSGGYEVLAWQPGPEHTAWSWAWSTRLGGDDDYRDCGTTQWYKDCGDDNTTCEFVVRFDYCGMRSEIW